MKNFKSDESLLILLKNGDTLAFYNIYERYCKKLYHFVLKSIKQETDAEEIVQDVFVKIWEMRDKIETNTSFESFLFRIAYNETMDLFRKRISEKKYVEYIKSIQQSEATTNTTDELRYNELSREIDSLLEELTPRQREVFCLSRSEGFSNKEISKKLDISENTVKKHLLNARSYLKSHLDKELICNVLFICLFL